MTNACAIAHLVGWLSHKFSQVCSLHDHIRSQWVNRSPQNSTLPMGVNQENSSLPAIDKSTVKEALKELLEEIPPI